MGISWSNRRRNNYLQNPPPPYHSSSSFYYPSEPTSLPPPPQTHHFPNSHPPPPHSHPYTPTPQPIPLPPIPPAPAPHSYYFSGGYNSCNYGNSPMGRFNFHPHYANQSNGWSQIRPVMVPPFLPPPSLPFVEHRQAKKVRNDVNVHKDTLRIEVDGQNPDQHLVSFVFDALYDGSITILFFAKEEPNCRFVPIYPDAFKPVKIPFQKGPAQKFFQPMGTGFDLGFFELDDLSKPSPSEDVFPLVISAETCSPSQSNDERIGEPQPDNSHMQITQAVLEKKNGNPFQVKVIRQLLWIDGMRYELREIFGIGSSSSEGFDNNDSGKECVICMTEPKDTAVLPCRHMCMCSECAKELKLQSNKCPICRQPIEELIEIKINNSNQ
ncbi:probable E3 ubiquitin-protein ligase LUL4 [Cucurbita pepo subsp. pepo]|uniref:probable E3 ubiquitin-protein ligase LUL4 n=1 Tax=Cucurbita pepo subsp. pepo TaxID=3664 RepID=UPI000C9D418A|nr:probable E3 ubiquitin-protein ligase LUL4 [Cucurbita pepo subsp. pepo]